MTKRQCHLSYPTEDCMIDFTGASLNVEYACLKYSRAGHEAKPETAKELTRGTSYGASLWPRPDPASPPSKGPKNPVLPAHRTEASREILWRTK